jgi:hypothetical protein
MRKSVFLRKLQDTVLAWGILLIYISSAGTSLFLDVNFIIMAVISNSAFLPATDLTNLCFTMNIYDAQLLLIFQRAVAYQ